MKSGPKDLAAYHQQVLAKENHGRKDVATKGVVADGIRKPGELQDSDNIAPKWIQPAQLGSNNALRIYGDVQEGESMSPETQAALDGIDLERGHKRLAEMGVGKQASYPTLNGIMTMADGIAAPNATPAQGPSTSLEEEMERGNPAARSPTGKRIRKDAGVPRKPKPAPEPPAKGTLTFSQIADILQACEEIERMRDRFNDAAANLREAVAKRKQLLDSMVTAD